ncbi:aromatic amino acid DMT transporter YddG [Acinetobacter haemolyticus]|uniref:aromatic amino acid DMT transporter YddG n=1 Tax=Acinetobacter haemolyticus TaxID=29430 RepID=UPI001331D132|nr:aromatic amino acid DMT transporter YddG [Acinetobacter haemolyticus]NAR17593.1 aromatic amino acid DMT transporter YddG [Acinetobacter haemolyticus]NAR35975.1 aromatic amino acid DMT transporter YddG [Acinetobacter haemolyticus]NAR47893.1 aromatic amino acid DMT transporter YddG [Acinetobacter haemolyticus]QHI18510.1 drug/metabolite DMT transporter permease [Acinetobacter haemolyticus]
MNSKKATLIGLVAILLWSLIVALIKDVSSHFGEVGGAALIYTLALIFLFFSVGWSSLRTFPRTYLIWGSFLFVAYEICLSLSIGYSQNNRQAIEVGMVNYLWPTFTMVAAILFNQQKADVLIIPGFAISLLGIGWVLGGEQGFDLPNMWGNIQSNPLSYGLAFVGTLLWAAYCTLTARIAKGANGITLFFTLVAVVLWIKYLLMGGGGLNFDWSSSVSLVMAAVAMGFGYAAWNVGILHGNVTLLAGASYFIPVFSALFAAFLLSTPLELYFWYGAFMVCIGSILCWFSTRTRKD